MKPAKQASFSCRNAIFMEFMCDIYQIWTICKSTALLFDGKLTKKFPSQKCMSILAYTIITLVFLAIISIAIKRVLVILKCREIILFLREAAERCSWGRRNSFFARWSCGCGFRYSNNIHHFLCWKWKYFYKFFLKPWVCIFVLRVNITWNITICPRSGWDSTEWRAVMITDHGIVDVVGVGDHGLGEAWLHHIDHALLRIQHL